MTVSTTSRGRDGTNLTRENNYLDDRYQRAVLEAIAKAAAVLNGVTS